jgi:hypothetical protein
MIPKGQLTACGKAPTFDTGKEVMNITISGSPWIKHEFESFFIAVTDFTILFQEP